ncbi:hypothetical protein BC938DRAFT_483063 [Jimgerdemannia flammicorona]|uniref:Uncharacterized protein n=1 Tax=Jimgerdemannia flammicorona TaxID=994334 RepID=A0A433QCQ6_9FUNG|nr:hypothetical protein BC938DRAFT_483063 [Jimgerdemannia flammicorona]
MVFRKFIQFFEFSNNPLLDPTNSEGFLQVHIYGLLIDSLFLDMDDIKIVPGEIGSRAVAYRKNVQRQLDTKKKYSLKMDAAVRMRDAWAGEILTLESGRCDSLEGQTKFLQDRYKLARELKDQIDYLYASLPSQHKKKIADLEVFGVLTSGGLKSTVFDVAYKGIEGTVYVMNLPCSGVYKFSKLFHFELPQTFQGLGKLIKVVMRLLTLKQRVRAVVNLLGEISQKVSLDTLSNESMWSPVTKMKAPIRETPSTPSRAPTKVSLHKVKKKADVLESDSDD